MKINLDRIVDVELPHYRKDNAHWYKVCDSDDGPICILVSGCDFIEPHIQQMSAKMAWVNKTEECTREEFEAAFTKVHEALLELADLDNSAQIADEKGEAMFNDRD